MPPKSKIVPQPEELPSAVPVTVQDLWAFCEKCKKWRRLPPQTALDDGDWFCSMHPDPAQRSCNRPEEVPEVLPAFLTAPAKPGRARRPPVKQEPKSGSGRKRKVVQNPDTPIEQAAASHSKRVKTEPSNVSSVPLISTSSSVDPRELSQPEKDAVCHGLQKLAMSVMEAAETQPTQMATPPVLDVQIIELIHQKDSQAASILVEALDSMSSSMYFPSSVKHTDLVLATVTACLMAVA